MVPDVSDKQAIKIPFVLDTGSSITCIHPTDAERLGIDLRSVREEREVVKGSAIGGETEYVIYGASVGFRRYGKWFWEKSRVWHFTLGLYVALPNESNERTPSLLGRDIINRLKIEYDRLGNGLRYDPRRADHKLDLR